MGLIKYTFSLLAFGLLCCARKKTDISKDEIKILKKIAIRYDASTTLELDYEAINRQSDEGEYFLELSFQKFNEICTLDSLQRYQIIKDVQQKISPVLSYQGNHSILTIILNNHGDVKSGAQKANCTERYSIRLKDRSIIRYYGEFESNIVHW